MPKPIDKPRKRKNSDPLPTTPNKASRSAITKGRPLTQPSKRDESTSNASNKSTLDENTGDIESVLVNNKNNIDSVECGICHSMVSTDKLNVTSLKCNLCEIHFHGSCLNDNVILLGFLHVISDFGGWCCSSCLKGKKCAKIPPKTKTIQSIENMNEEVLDIKKQLQSITVIVQTILSTHNKPPSSTSPASFQTTCHACSAGNAASLSTDPVQPSESTSRPLEKNFKTAVLSAVHAELEDVNKRSTGFVISGLPVRQGILDADQVTNICLQFLNLNPEIKSTYRLGNKIEGKPQPLLVNLTNSRDASNIISLAKTLRSSNNDFVKNNIFINRHLTKAEAQAAYDKRKTLRNKKEKENHQTINQNLIDIDPPMSTNDNADTTPTSAAHPGSAILTQLNSAANIFVPGQSTTLNCDLTNPNPKSSN